MWRLVATFILIGAWLNSSFVFMILLWSESNSGKSVTQSTRSATKTAPKPSTTRSWWLLVLIFRLLLLGVGGGLALIGGIVLANTYPNPNPEKPLLLKVLEALDKKTSHKSTFVQPPNYINFHHWASPTDTCSKTTGTSKAEPVAGAVEFNEWSHGDARNTTGY